jgi:hypothetical protein
MFSEKRAVGPDTDTDPDQVGSETSGRIPIRIRKKSFRIRAAPD